MAKETEILAFEDLLKDDHIRNKNREPKPNRSVSYLASVFVYVMIMFIFGAIVFTLFRGIDGFTHTYSENEMILYTIAHEPNGIGVLDIESYDQIENPSEVHILGEHEGYYIFVNLANLDAEKLLMTEIDGVTVLNIHLLEEIFKENPTLKTWNDQGHAILIYSGENQALPNFIKAPSIAISGPQTVLTDFALALSNFLVYLAILPPIIFLMKADLSDDFMEIKSKKKELFILVLTGYLYLILGNIIANFISKLLSETFNVPITDAQNQMVIVAALRSDGAILMIISAILIGPIVEELIFRKAIFGLFKKDSTGLLVSTFAFGVIHVASETNLAHALVNGISYFVMGAVFGLIYLRNKKNIIVPMIIHVLSNLIAVLGVLFIL